MKNKQILIRITENDQSDLKNICRTYGVKSPHRIVTILVETYLDQYRKEKKSVKENSINEQVEIILKKVLFNV